MSPVEAYLEVNARVGRVTARCDGLIADVRQRHEALRRWQDGVAQRAPVEALEEALTDFTAGEPPSWAALQAALQEWTEVTSRALALWNALSADERAGLAPPAVQLPEDGQPLEVDQLIEDG